MTQQRYQGWANYETWITATWLSNDAGMYAMLQGWAKEAREPAAEHPLVADGVWSAEEAVKVNLADRIRECIEESIPQLEGPYSALLEAAMSQIDWGEIAEHYLKE